MRATEDTAEDGNRYKLHEFSGAFGTLGYHASKHGMLRPLNWKELTHSSPLLAALPVSLRGAVQLLKFSQGQRLFARGDRPKAMHNVLSGEVRLVRLSRSGGEIVLQRTHSGFLAEASLDQRAYHCDAVAVVSTELLAIPRQVFNEALNDAAFRQQWIEHLARELRRVRAQAERLSLKTARERILHFGETEGDDGRIVLTQPKKDWAAELGLTHEALYRALARMERAGEIYIDGLTLVIRS